MNTGHAIKHRSTANDKIMTPPDLAASLVSSLALKGDLLALDPFRGSGAFYDNLLFREWCEIDEGRDFFDHKEKVDWIVSNPPYSILDEVLVHSTLIADKGIAYLLLGHAVTPKRIEMMEKMGFGLTRIHYCKVFKWYGISAFCVWEKGKKSIVTYDRKVWR